MVKSPPTSSPWESEIYVARDESADCVVHRVFPIVETIVILYDESVVIDHKKTIMKQTYVEFSLTSHSL